jgi:hypothetical protein
LSTSQPSACQLSKEERRRKLKRLNEAWHRFRSLPPETPERHAANETFRDAYTELYREGVQFRYNGDIDEYMLLEKAYPPFRLDCWYQTAGGLYVHILEYCPESSKNPYVVATMQRDIYYCDAEGVTEVPARNLKDALEIDSFPGKQFFFFDCTLVTHVKVIASTKAEAYELALEALVPHTLNRDVFVRHIDTTVKQGSEA